MGLEYAMSYKIQMADVNLDYSGKSSLNIGKNRNSAMEDVHGYLG